MEKKYCVRCDEPVIDKKPACPLLCMSPKCTAYQNRSTVDPEVTPIIWVLGGPGSGKETQCLKIVAQYGFTHLSTGELLRDEVNSGSERGKCLSSIMERGGLVPNDIVLALLKEAMLKHADTAHGFLIDGYPREKSQGIAFEKVIAPVTAILYFHASPETLKQRLNNRKVSSNRKDDNKYTIKLRLLTFSEHNHTILKQYKDKLITIDAEPTPDVIFNEVKQHMEPIVSRADAAKIIKKRKAFEIFTGTPTAANDDEAANSGQSTTE